jgi:hypothetical protein
LRERSEVVFGEGAAWRDVPTSSSEEHPGAMWAETTLVPGFDRHPDLYQFLVVADCPEAWIVPACLGFDDGGSHTAVEHLAILKFLQDQFDAVVAKVNIDSIAVTLRQPLDPDAVQRYAPLIASYAGSVGLNQHARRAEVESYLRHSTVWTFNLH